MNGPSFQQGNINQMRGMQGNSVNTSMPVPQPGMMQNPGMNQMQGHQQMPGQPSMSMPQNPGQNIRVSPLLSKIYLYFEILSQFLFKK